MNLAPSDADIQTHKFLHDARLLSGMIDNLMLDKADVDKGSDAMPEMGTVRECATKLKAKLEELIGR